MSSISLTLERQHPRLHRSIIVMHAIGGCKQLENLMFQHASIATDMIVGLQNPEAAIGDPIRGADSQGSQPQEQECSSDSA